MTVDDAGTVDGATTDDAAQAAVESDAGTTDGADDVNELKQQLAAAQAKAEAFDRLIERGGFGASDTAPPTDDDAARTAQDEEDEDLERAALVQLAKRGDPGAKRILRHEQALERQHQLLARGFKLLANRIGDAELAPDRREAFRAFYGDGSAFTSRKAAMDIFDRTQTPAPQPKPSPRPRPAVDTTVRPVPAAEARERTMTSAEVSDRIARLHAAGDHDGARAFAAGEGTDYTVVD